MLLLLQTDPANIGRISLSCPRFKNPVKPTFSMAPFSRGKMLRSTGKSDRKRNKPNSEFRSMMVTNLRFVVDPSRAPGDDACLPLR